MNTNAAHPLIVATGIAISAGFSTSATGEQGSASFPSVGRQQLQIVNPNSIKIHFQISCNDVVDDWDEQTLDANTNAQFFCTPNTPPKLYFKMVTTLPSKPRQQVEYVLEWGDRYQLEFDELAARWDIKKITR